MQAVEANWTYLSCMHGLSSVQFSSFCFDKPGMLHLQHKRSFFHAGPGPRDDIITELA